MVSNLELYWIEFVMCLNGGVSHLSGMNIERLFPGLRDRHWEQISEIVGYPLKPDDDMTLSKLVDMNLESSISKFESISEAASKEYALEKAMIRMKEEWEPVRRERGERVKLP